MAYKAGLFEALGQLEKITGPGSAEHLRAVVNGETDERKLFLMLQTIREVIAKETKSTSEFTFKDKDGVVHKATTLEDAMQIASKKVV